MQGQTYEMKGDQAPPTYGEQQPLYPAQPYPAQPYPNQQYPPQQYPAQTVVVAPQPVAMTRDGQPVQDNLIISIISIFFCCILGIIATVKANNSKEALRAGRVDDAQAYSMQAKKLAIAAIVTGCILIAISIFITFILPLIMVGVFSTSSTSSSY